MAGDLAIDPVSISANADRVSALVDGAEIYFESDDVPLIACPEAFTGTMLLPALQANRRLVTADALERNWLVQVEKLCDIFGKWWNYPRSSPIVAPANDPTGIPLTGSAACFTCGVDSFYAQLRGKDATEHLVFVHGFDIGLNDVDRFAKFEKSFRQVAVALGKKAVVVRTNFAEHPAFKLVSWERSHGAALAGVGLTLGGVIGKWVIPSSYTAKEDTPWGSNWRTDLLWSTSRVRVMTSDTDIQRRDKLKLIAAEPIVQKHLHVCWEKLSPELNCSKCEKCLRSMMVLSPTGLLEKFSVFDQSIPLARRLDEKPYLKPHIVYVYEDMVKAGLPADVSAAVRRLIARTRRRYDPPSLLRRAVRKVRGWWS